MLSSETVIRAGTPENPYSKDVTIVHGPEMTTYHCQRCEDTFRDEKDKARVKYLKHQVKAHNVKNPQIHSFEPDEADDFWIQDYL